MLRRQFGATGVLGRGFTLKNYIYPKKFLNFNQNGEIIGKLS